MSSNFSSVSAAKEVWHALEDTQFCGEKCVSIENVWENEKAAAY